MPMYIEEHATFSGPSFEQVHSLAFGVEVVETSAVSKLWRDRIGRSWAQVLVPSTVSTLNYSKPADTEWLFRSLGLVEQIDKVSVGDEVAEASEYLVAHFAVWPEGRRPSLGLDFEGRPHFSAKSDNFYLHLTVEEGPVLNWFAKVNGKEVFEDEDHAFRTHLSPKLAELAK